MAGVTEERNPTLRIVGGHPALDLVNTVAPRVPGGGDHHDYLADPEDLLAWARRVDVVSPGEADAVGGAWRASPTAAAQAWRATVDIREDLYAVLVSQLAGDASGAAPGLERLTLRWAAAAARSTLVADEDPGRAAQLVVGTAPGLMIPDRLAHTAVELLRTVDLSRLKTCPLDEGGCGWLFLDLSRNGSRRWCAMADCGTQAKVRRLTERRRSSRATTVERNGTSI
jgi:predicted RNA-binding Zn ribbon-like protein